MKTIDSIVLAFDGESKCGKTTVIQSVAKEAQHQKYTYGHVPYPGGAFGIEKNLLKTRDFIEANAFNHITTISAGNAFRAAALHVALLALKGEKKERFTDSDTPDIKNLLELDGITDILQNDPNIGTQVSAIANMPGIQNLGGAIFSDSVRKAYHRDGGSNLIIVDARDPVGHMQRNGVIGNSEGQIAPASIMPIYIDTPTEVAASRMVGDYHQKFVEISGRRHIDAHHHENPVVMPQHFIDDFSDWTAQFPIPNTSDGLALPHRLDNHEGINLMNIQYFSGMVALRAQEQGVWLNYYRAAENGPVA